MGVAEIFVTIFKDRGAAWALRIAVVLERYSTCGLNRRDTDCFQLEAVTLIETF